MSTKANLIVMHNGTPFACLHTDFDGGRASVGATLLDALSRANSVPNLVERLVQPSDSAFKLTEFTLLTPRQSAKAERQLEYLISLTGEGSELNADFVFIHDRFQPSNDFNGAPADFLKQLKKMVRGLGTSAFVDQARGQQEFLSGLDRLDTGLVAYRPSKALEPLEKREKFLER